MKKVLLTGALILTLGIGSLVAYADTARTPNIISGNRNTNLSIEDKEAWFKERTEYKKEQIKNALENGLITEEEAKVWEEHFKDMEEFHVKNGFMPGGCGGFGMGRGMGFGRGMGMMRGNNWGK
jgi:hypothetical protein